MPLFDTGFPWRQARARAGALARNLLRSELHQVRADLKADYDAALSRAVREIAAHVDTGLSGLKQEATANIEARLDVIQQLFVSALQDPRHKASSPSETEATIKAFRDQIFAQLSLHLHDIGQIVSDGVERASGLALTNETGGRPEALQDSIDNELGEQLRDISGQVEGNKHGIQKVLHDSENRFSHLETNFGSQLNEIQSASSTAFADIRHRLDMVGHELKGKLSYLEASFTSQSGELQSMVATSSAQVRENRNWLEKISVESSNRLTHLTTSIHSRLNEIENLKLPEVIEQVHTILSAQLAMAAPALEGGRWAPHPAERYQPAKAESFEFYLESAERDFANVFPPWKERLDRTAEAFDRTKVGNAAHAGDLYSRTFRDFVALYCGGRVLDVGCGVFGRPYYLQGIAPESISGLEPLPQKEPVDFELVRGISEYLPWPDQSFSTVISATSLDHCLSLERSLAEMRRVMRPRGQMLLWLSSIQGARRFEPEDPDFEPIDQYHLFHFDKAWLEPMLLQYFEVERQFEFSKTGYSHVFYRLLLR